MYKKFHISLLISIIVLSVDIIYGQTKTKSTDYSDQDFAKLLAQPQDFSEKQQGDIYMDHVKKLISIKLDTGYVLFDEMAIFGLKNKSNLVTALAYNNKGSMYLTMRNAEKSYPYFKKALPFAKNYADTYVNVLYNLSLYYQNVGKLDSALMMIDTAQIIVTTKNVSLKQKASFYVARAEILCDLNKFHSAIESFQDALAIIDPEENALKYTNTLFRVSQMYNLLNNNAKAIEYVTEAIKISEKNKYLSSLSAQYLEGAKYFLESNDFIKTDTLLFKSIKIATQRKDSIKLNRTYCTLAMLSLKRNNIPETKKNITRANNYYSAIKEMGDKLPQLTVQGELALNLKNYDEANQYYSQMLTIARQTQQTNTSIAAFTGLKKIAFAQQNYKETAIYADSLFYYLSKKDITNQSNILYDLETKYQKNKQDQEIVYLNELKASQDKIIAVRTNTILLGSIMLAILTFMLMGLYRLYKKNQESQTKLALQNSKITETLAQNQMLIKEIHHRVKNNLQVISSLLHLQERKVEDGAARDALKSSQARVNTMSLIHKSLYQKEDVRFVDVQQYFTKLTENLISSFALEQVKVALNIEPLNIDVDSLVPLGLVANELICNALKHGIAHMKDGEIAVSLIQKNDSIILSVEDNGAGLSSNELLPKEGSLGTRLIKAFTNNLDGELIIEGKGKTKISLVIPKSQLLFKV